MIKVEQTGTLIPPEILAQLSTLDVDELMGNIAAAARNHWVRLAGEDSSHLAFEYVSGILPVETRRGFAVIGLVGEIPHLLENGDTSLNMRETLLGPNVPVAPFGQKGKRLAKAGHYYRAIPFRHVVPGGGKTLGQEMGSAYNEHDVVVDAKALYKAARKLTATTSEPGKGVTYGGRLKAGFAPLLRAHHKTDIYAGMIRQQKTYEKATQSQYHTFRTISQAVTDGWIRKPIEARNYLQSVHQFVQRLAPKAISALLEGR